VRLFSIMGTPTSHGYGLAVDCWTAPGEYNYTQLDARFRMVLDACPQAYVFPRLYISAPPWWLDQHPDAVVKYDPGDGHPVPFVQDSRRVPSWASPAWRAAAVEALQHLIAHVQQQPYADHVLGYHLASGTTEEWMYWGANDDMWCDYGTDNTVAFRGWLQARYGTDTGLQTAWNRAGATLATAVVPPKAERARSAAGTLRDPATDTPSMDYYRYLADATAETIDLLCGAVKKATGGERITGVFYGYLLQLFGQRQQNAAHLGFDRVVRSPNVDFICSPTSYAFRHLGDGTSHFMGLLGSVRLHGKLWMDENDIRTSLSQGALGEWGRPADVAGDMLQQDRELANVLTNGVGQWWFDVGNNRYDSQELMAHLAKLAKVAKVTQEADRSPIDQVAMVVDGRGLCDINVGDNYEDPLILQQVPSLARIGAPVGHYEMSDVGALQRQKLIVFTGLYEPTDAERRAIRALQSGGRVLVFVHCAGPYRDGKWDPAGMEELCGLKLRLVDQQMPAKVFFSPGQTLTAGLGTSFGWGGPLRPVVRGDDPQATVLATLQDGSPGLMMRKYPTWTAIWSAAPNLPTGLLTRLADMAGVHRYLTTPDVMWATRELLAVTVNEAGKRTITLPGPAKVTDLYAGTVVSEHTTTFEADLPAAGTKLYRVEAVR
jgi:hypothetical protein